MNLDPFLQGQSKNGQSKNNSICTVHCNKSSKSLSTNVPGKLNIEVFKETGEVAKVLTSSERFIQRVLLGKKAC